MRFLPTAWPENPSACRAGKCKSETNTAFNCAIMVMAIHTNSLLQGDGIKLSPLMGISYNCAKHKPLRQRLMEWPALHVTGTAHCFYGKALNGQSIWRQGDSWQVRTSHLPTPKIPCKAQQVFIGHTRQVYFYCPPFPTNEWAAEQALPWTTVE